jgi:hypothetical protein
MPQGLGKNCLEGRTSCQLSRNTPTRLWDDYRVVIPYSVPGDMNISGGSQACRRTHQPIDYL